MQVRTRFAPSPTGYLHIGGVRTALFSWLYAKRHAGKFILRIEDTDKERSTAESIQAILDGMHWLEMDYDEGPFYQTKRMARYLEVIQTLIDKGFAYRCNCSKERLDKLREQQLAAKQKPRYDGCCRDKNLADDGSSQVVRFKNQDTGTVTFNDEVYGCIQVANHELDDLIILRSDGSPTYNLAVVVDDMDMQITHVIRGDDHINNTPRQINLLKALDANIPVYAHLPMILGADGKRLSKRHGAVSVLQFREEGILPHALLNYLVRLGWSFGDQEIFSLEEMIAKFNLQSISRGATSFDYNKLIWLNQHYQKSDSPAKVAEALAWHFKQKNVDITNGPSLVSLVTAQAERCKNLVEMCESSLFFYQDEIFYDDSLLKKHINTEARRLLNLVLNDLQRVDNWQKDVLQKCISDIVVAEDVGFGKLAQPLRVAVTGSTKTPSIDITLELLGKGRVINRLIQILEITC